MVIVTECTNQDKEHLRDVEKGICQLFMINLPGRLVIHQRRCHYYNILQLFYLTISLIKLLKTRICKVCNVMEKVKMLMLMK